MYVESVYNKDGDLIADPTSYIPKDASELRAFLTEFYARKMIESRGDKEANQKVVVEKGVAV